MRISSQSPGSTFNINTSSPNWFLDSGEPQLRHLQKLWRVPINHRRKKRGYWWGTPLPHYVCKIRETDHLAPLKPEFVIDLRNVLGIV